MLARLRASYKKQLFVCLIVVAILPLAITGMSLIELFKVTVSRSYANRAYQELQGIEKEIENEFQKLDDAILKITTDEDIITSLVTDGTDDTQKRSEAYVKLYQYTQPVKSEATFNIYDESGVCRFSTGTSGHENDLPLYWSTLKRANAHSEETVLSDANYDADSHDSSIRMARAIYTAEPDAHIIGYVVLMISEENFETILSGTYDEDSSLAILNKYWEEVYSTKKARDYDMATTLRLRRFTGEDLKQPDDRVDFYIREIMNQELYIVISREPVFSTDITKVMYYVILVMIFVSLIFSILVANYMSRNLMKPIDRLTRAMNEVKKGDLDVQLHTHRTDELGQLTNTFSLMTKELKDYTERQVQQQKELNDANIAMMQAQLNPHFFYNTLDTMKWVSKAHHVPELVTISEGLARILRTSISPDRFIKLSEELSLVESYVGIQRIRFSGSFTYDCEVPMEYEDLQIPKLAIQPIVENAIIHGLDGCTNGHIFLNVSAAGSDLHIDVMDDGCGISDEMMSVINDKKYASMKGHLGFYNVDRIVQIYYGDRYGLTARRVREDEMLWADDDADIAGNVADETRRVHGTVITLTLPINDGA